jgi:hypothetical protein
MPKTVMSRLKVRNLFGVEGSEGSFRMGNASRGAIEDIKALRQR